MKNSRTAIALLCALSGIGTAVSVLAADNVGTLTMIEGEVRLFTHPSKTLPKEKEADGSRAKFEGEYYLVTDAKPGDKLENGNVIRTAPGGKARIVYDNGDQFNLGGGTAYRVNWKGDEPLQVGMMYGKLRGVIEKGGPRSGLRIRSKSATMGVRGTDFFVATDTKGEMEVSVIRGAVEVKADSPQARPVEVKAAETATVSAKAPAAEVRKTTQEELQSIQRSAQFAPAAKEEARQELIQKLEEKAAKTTLADIRKTDPTLYAKLEQSPPASAAEVNAAAIQQIKATAPSAPEKRKPFKSELENLEGDAYQKYFKNAE